MMECLRTNLSVLRRFEELSPTSRVRLLDDVDSESREFTDLVNELVELATDRRTTEAWQPVNLLQVVSHVCDLFRRRSDREIHIIAQETDPVIIGQPHSLERALSNLVDNAIKFDPQSTAPIEVSVSAQEISVADRGPGLAVAELDRVFDRFYRSPEARSLPGSGLGLSIVKDVAQAHGGSANAANRAGGGAMISLTFAGDPIPTADSGRSCRVWGTAGRDGRQPCGARGTASRR